MEKYERLTKRAGWHKDIDLKDELGYSYIYQRLAELENSIEDGEIVRLPCKVGDTVYYETFINNGIDSVGVQPHQVKSIYTSITTSNFSGYGYTTVALAEFGKTVFLTKDEAEEKLKENK